MDLNALKYAKSHEWAATDSTGVVTIGITSYAVEQLTDVTHLQLPKVGTKTTAGKLFVAAKSERAADDFLHDLVGAAVNTLHAGIDVSAGDREFPHVAVAAVQLQAFIHHLALEIRDPVFGHRSCLGG